jgi:hypothetical protein
VRGAWARPSPPPTHLPTPPHLHPLTHTTPTHPRPAPGTRKCVFLKCLLSHNPKVPLGAYVDFLMVDAWWWMADGLGWVLASYNYRYQYMFGDHVLVAPVTQPSDPSTGTVTSSIWLPSGAWTHVRGLVIVWGP